MNEIEKKNRLIVHLPSGNVTEYVQDKDYDDIVLGTNYITVKKGDISTTFASSACVFKEY